MKAEVRVSPQVELFLKSRAPEPRQTLRKAIKALAAEQGDIKALEGKPGGLESFAGIKLPSPLRGNR